MEDTTLDGYSRRLKEIGEQRKALITESVKLTTEEIAAPYGSDESLEIRGRQAVMAAEMTLLDNEYDELSKKQMDELDYIGKRYARPEGRPLNLLNKTLGPLPARQRVIVPTKGAFQEVGSQRVGAVILAVVLAAVASILLWSAPIMRLGLVSVVYLLTGDLVSGFAVSLVVATVLVVYYHVSTLHPPHDDNVGRATAMASSLWFRTGAESWTWKQRMGSMIVFAVTRLCFVAVPLLTLLVYSTLGAVLLLVYLREHRRHGDVRLATLASAKFQATWQRSLEVLIIAATVILVAVSIFI